MGEEEILNSTTDVPQTSSTDRYRYRDTPLVIMERRGVRRRSTSLGEGDILSSTTNVPQASSTDRFANVNPDRCVSNPQIDLIGFTDDVTGDQLEARTRTRSRGLPDYTDDRLRYDYTRLKVAVYKWGENICSRAHLVDVIEREHNVLCAQIEHKISEVLLRRGTTILWVN